MVWTSKLQRFARFGHQNVGAAYDSTRELASR
jgi:hypothetical protein